MSDPLGKVSIEHLVDRLRREVTPAMSTTMVPANMDDAMKMLEVALGMQQCVLGFLAAQDAADLPAGAAADQLRALERADAVGSALRGRLLEVFDAQDGHLA